MDQTVTLTAIRGLETGEGQDAIQAELDAVGFKLLRAEAVPLNKKATAFGLDVRVQMFFPMNESREECLRIAVQELDALEFYEIAEAK